MLAVARKEKIMAFLQTRHTATVNELSRLCRVSTVTIRQDLEHLADDGLVLRTRGGALLSDRANREFTASARERMNVTAKQRIGEAGAALVRPGDSLIVDASSTALYLVRALLRRRDLSDVTIITNSLYTALELANRADITTIVTGGFVRSTAVSLTGSFAWDMLAKINAHWGFFGTRGISREHGLTEVNVQEANLKIKMIERCQTVVAVADGSKFGEVSLVSFAPLDNVQRIITDDSAPAQRVAEVRAHGVEVTIA
jgi:DeoR/GlpR family transcriptional regulator of sugar metabolism